MKMKIICRKFQNANCMYVSIFEREKTAYLEPALRLRSSTKKMSHQCIEIVLIYVPWKK